ncbi:actin cytoskeleton-regulatory complex protein pan1-like [Panthera leo]|uniref:actin cytoskeleton-regulatory complex protein pan1-like n=1 Tax=Panthera leo TaxID=9689 RepID=UPI001C6A808D|nr:actin cytoskeleton-regulatory complex protein pan1-like [Panthera leo]
MEKLMSGASMGSRRKRAGIGATESASRPRRGGAVEREEERRLRGGGRATEGSWGLAHSFAGTAAPKQQAEKLPSSSERPTSTRVPETLLLLPPPPPPPARAAPPRTSPRAPPPPPPMPPGCFRLEPSANHKRAPESSGSRPRPPFAPPRPSPSPPWATPDSTLSNYYIIQMKTSKWNTGNFNPISCHQPLPATAVRNPMILLLTNHWKVNSSLTLHHNTCVCVVHFSLRFISSWRHFILSVITRKNQPQSLSFHSDKPADVISNVISKQGPRGQFW